MCALGGKNTKRGEHLGKAGTLRIVSEITFHFGEQVFSAGKASKEAYSGYYITFLTTQSRAEKMPPKWNVISDTILNITTP